MNIDLDFLAYPLKRNQKSCPNIDFKIENKASSIAEKKSKKIFRKNTLGELKN